MLRKGNSQNIMNTEFKSNFNFNKFKLHSKIGILGLKIIVISLPLLRLRYFLNKFLDRRFKINMNL